MFKAEWLPLLAPNPLILAMANPEPEILPEMVAAAAARRHHGHRPQRTIPTRSTTSCASRSSSAARWTSARSEINEAMKVAAVEAIAELARAEASEVVASAYGGVAPMFGASYIIPKPFDPRLILQDRPGRGRARPWTAASPPARSPTSTPIAPSWSGSSTARAS